MKWPKRTVGNIKWSSVLHKWLAEIQVKELLYQIQSMNVNKSEFDPLLDKLMKNLNNHIDEEEVNSKFHRVLITA